MTVALPTSPAPQDAKPRLVRFGADLTPSLGGPVQRIIRPGSRFQVDVTLPPLTSEQARAWRAALLKADAAGATVTMPFPEFDGVSLGAGAVVDGAGQAGTSLAIRGVQAGVAVPAGSFFSIVSGARRYLHMTTEDASTGSGSVVLAIAPMLRVSPVDGAQILSAPAVVEGFIDGQTLDWEDRLDRTTAISFTLSEAA